MRLLIVVTAVLLLAGCKKGATGAKVGGPNVVFDHWGPMYQLSGTWRSQGFGRNAGDKTARVIQWADGTRSGPLDPDMLNPTESGYWTEPAWPDGHGGYQNPTTTPTFTWSDH